MAIGRLHQDFIVIDQEETRKGLAATAVTEFGAYGISAAFNGAIAPVSRFAAVNYAAARRKSTSRRATAPNTMSAVISRMHR